MYESQTVRTYGCVVDFQCITKHKLKKRRTSIKREHYGPDSPLGRAKGEAQAD